MTRTTNARIAGVMLLLYIVVGVTQMILFGGATAGDGTAARLANMAQHATDVRVNVVLALVTCFVALALGVALYALTRDQDPDLAMLALLCRVGEAVVGISLIPMTLGLLSLAVAAGENAPDAAAANSVVFLVLAARRANPTIAAIFFAVGSGLFSWLLLRGRMIPVGLAWLGVLASVLLVVALPLQLTGVLRAPLTNYIWLPMAAFEIPLALWLLVKGAAASARMEPARSY
jgi:hypothetical protein